MRNGNLHQESKLSEEAMLHIGTEKQLAHIKIDDIVSEQHIKFHHCTRFLLHSEVEGGPPAEPLQIVL